MSYDLIKVEHKGRVGVITLNRPKQMNALNPQLMQELGVALQAFDAHADTGAMVITGSPNFSDSAYGSNDEAMYVIHNRPLARKYDAAFHVFYDRSIGPQEPLVCLAVIARLTASPSYKP